MNYNEEFIKKMRAVGTLGYSLNKIINVLDIDNKDIKSFTADFNNENSIIRLAYQKGVDQSDYLIDMKLFELAKKGDLKALEKYEKRKNFQMRQNDLSRENDD